MHAHQRYDDQRADAHAQGGGSGNPVMPVQQESIGPCGEEQGDGAGNTGGAAPEPVGIGSDALAVQGAGPLTGDRVQGDAVMAVIAIAEAGLFKD